MRSRILLGLVPCLAAGLAVGLSSGEASANGLSIGIDPNLGLMGGYGAGTGAGIAGRLGYRFGAGPRRHWRGPFVTPEVGFEYMSFLGPTQAISNENFFGGLRFGWSSRFVEPQLYAHLGLGLTNEQIAGFRTIQGGGTTSTGLNLEGGGALNFKLGRIFKLGAHLGPDVLFASPESIAYLKLGLQAEIVF